MRAWYSRAAIQRHPHRGHWYTSPRLLVHGHAAANTFRSELPPSYSSPAQAQYSRTESFCALYKVLKPNTFSRFPPIVHQQVDDS